MNERDELAEVIANFHDDWYENGRKAPAGIDRDEAAHILAAGYRKPRGIATAAERAILQPGTICMDKDGNAWKRGTGSWVSTGGDTGPLYDEDDLELTVLHEGTQP